MVGPGRLGGAEQTGGGLVVARQAGLGAGQRLGRLHCKSSACKHGSLVSCLVIPGDTEVSGTVNTRKLSVIGLFSSAV